MLKAAIFCVIFQRKYFDLGLAATLLLYQMSHCLLVTLKLRNFSSLKVSKGAKIRNRHNQAPRLSRDTNGKVTNSQLDKRSVLSAQVTTRHTQRVFDEKSRTGPEPLRRIHFSVAVKTQIRCRTMRHFIRVCAVCYEKFDLRGNYNILVNYSP